MGSVSAAGVKGGCKREGECGEDVKGRSGRVGVLGMGDR